MEKLKIKELLQETYKTLVKNNPHEEISLKVFTEIADDSDDHRTRKGYMIYETLGLFYFDKKNYAIGIGNAEGYPAAPYNSDIMVLETSSFPEKKEDISLLEERIRKSPYFINSIIQGMSTEKLGIDNGSVFAEKMLTILQPRLPEFIIEGEYNIKYTSASGLGSIPSKISYKPELADFLSSSIEKILLKTVI